MAKKPSSTASQPRKPRLLWANPFCLMDTSSGASMTVRQMLLQLVASGYEVQVLGATIFDNPKGMGRLKEQFPDLSAHLHQLIEAEDGPLTHQLVVSYSHNRNHVTTHEEGLWYSQYLYLLDSFKPDVVWFYGGQTLDMLIADEARDRGIAVAFYLANGNYKSPRWCRDVDLILTDSQATAEMYRKEVGFAARPVGKFIDPSLFVAEHHERKRLLFVNPSWQKGASVFVQLAEKLERERPEIELEVVEARADWRAVLRETTQRMGKQRSTLKNVVVTPNTHDMRGPYSRARVLIAPSLWWESSGRVLAEAMLNGIPALITNRGGMPEMIDDAGIVFDLPEACYEEPYQHLLSDEELQPLYEAVLAFYDDEALYQDYAERAQRVGKQKHHIDRATERLLTALTPLVRPRAGNKDFSITQRKRHRQRLAGKATKPEFKTDNSLQSLVISKQGGGTTNAETPMSGLWLSDDFTWQLKSKVVVLDNRAKLIKSGLADQMAATSAFGIVAFDPASEVKDVQQYEGSEYIQVFQHALLGDGQPATLNACVAPELTGTLKPLPAEQLPEHRRLGAQPIAELPINTVALDSISGLDSLDWLILDELSDAIAVLENGKQSLKDTLLIQARVAFQPTHERQPSMAELQHWASRNGFRFYRFHDFQHHSHLPETLKERTNCATEQESADVLFLPSHERMAALTDEQKTKLAFVLSAVFRAHDMAFDLMVTVSQERAIELLEAQGFLSKAVVGVGNNYSHADNKREPKYLEGVNLHVMITEKFTAPFIEFIRKNIPESKNHYIITGNKVFAYGLNPEHGVEFIDKKEDFVRLESYMAHADKIIFHGLWSESACALLEKNPEFYKKTYWFMWGGDFYYPKKHSKLKRRVFKNIANLVTSINGDVEYVRNKYNAKGRFLWALYPNDLVVGFSGGKKVGQGEKNGPLNILLGNSAFETNNHFEAMDEISSIKDAGINYQIICPLSYGPKEYAEKVIAKGSEIFGENFKPLRDFMLPCEYRKFLSTIDVAVFNHTRQQAFNTTLILLSMGKRIFMNSQSNVYKQLAYEGFYVENINEFHVGNKHAERLDLNASMVVEEYSDFAIAKKMKSWIL